MGSRGLWQRRWRLGGGTSPRGRLRFDSRVRLGRCVGRPLRAVRGRGFATFRPRPGAARHCNLWYRLDLPAQPTELLGGNPRIVPRQAFAADDHTVLVALARQQDDVAASRAFEHRPDR